MAFNPSTDVRFTLPVKLVDQLRVRARLSGRSLNTSIVTILDLLVAGKLFIATEDHGLCRLTATGSVRVPGSKGAAGLLLQHVEEVDGDGICDGKTAGCGR